MFLNLQNWTEEGRSSGHQRNKQLSSDGHGPAGRAQDSLEQMEEVKRMHMKL